jgi:hypothetical protein
MESFLCTIIYLFLLVFLGLKLEIHRIIEELELSVVLFSEAKTGLFCSLLCFLFVFASMSCSKTRIFSFLFEARTYAEREREREKESR